MTHTATNIFPLGSGIAFGVHPFLLFPFHAADAHGHHGVHFHFNFTAAEKASWIGSLSQEDLNRVEVPSSLYAVMRNSWDLPFTLMQGTKGMRESGEAYLPRNSKEKYVDWRARLHRAVLTNIYKKTVNTLASKPFIKPAQLMNFDSTVEEWLTNNVNRQGDDINVFMRDVFKDAINAGLSHILAEFPRVEDDQVLTLADVRERGLRPYLTHIRAVDVLGWKSDVFDGIRTLTQLRIKETATVNRGAFGESVVHRIRVLEPGMFFLYEKDNESKDWSLIDFGDTSVPYIPLTTVYTNRVDFMVAEPPLDDLAWLNQAHWESTSDQRHVLHIARVPIMFGKFLGSQPNPETGETKIEVDVGPNSLTNVDNDKADLRYVEHSGSAIKSGADDLDRLLKTMEAFGMQFLVERPAGELTATQVSVEESSNNSELQRMVIAMEKATENAALDMVNIQGDIGQGAVGNVAYFKDFNVKFGGSEDIDLLNRMNIAGNLSTRTTIEETKRRGFLAPTVDIDEEIERLDNEAPTTLGGNPLGLN